MAAGAHQLSPIPSEKRARGLSDLGGMSYAPEAYGTTLALVEQNPAHSEKADEEGRGELRIFRKGRIPGCIPIREIERCEIGN